MRYILPLLLFLGCNGAPAGKNIQISGNIKGLPDGWMYLYEQGRLIVLDSARISAGKFSFDFTPGASQEPRQLQLKYNDTAKNGWAYRRLLGYTNPFLSNYGMSSFYTDFSPIKITGEKKGDNFLNSITGNPQNDVFFKMVNNPFNLNIPGDGDGRSRVIGKYQEVVKKAPHSFFLLESLEFVRENFSQKELKIVLNEFDGSVKQSLVWKDFDRYFEVRNNRELETKELTLDTDNNVSRSVLNPDAELNFVVFWASWCLPCRQEIPALKRLVSRYKDSVSFVSVSIDQDKKAWQQALEKEQMFWPQFVTNDTTIKKVNALFSVRSVPLIVILDNSGRMLKRITKSMDEEELNQLVRSELTVKNE